MNSNVPMTTRNPLVVAIAPSNQAAGAQSTGWISVADYFNFMALVNVGALGASGTVDGAKDVAGKAITQIVASNKTAAIDINQNDIDVTNGFTHIRLTITVGTAACDTAATVIGAYARYEKPDNNQADEVV